MKNLVKVTQTVDIEKIPELIYYFMCDTIAEIEKILRKLEASKGEVSSGETLNVFQILKTIEEVRDGMILSDSKLNDIYDVAKGYGNFLFNLKNKKEELAGENEKKDSE